MDDKELDDILDGALEDFEKLEVNSEKKEQIQVQQPLGSIRTEDKKLMDEFEGEMQKFFENFEKGDVKDLKDEEKLKATLESALKNLTETTKNLPKSGDMPDFENDEMFKKILGMFQSDGGDEKLGGALEKIMETLLSPEVLKEPMAQLKAKYPEWLKAKKGQIPEKEWGNVHAQYEYACRICDCYEKDPKNIMKLVELMKEMQELGSPPQEILDQLSTENGSPMPKMPDMNEKCPVQ
jgi:peroxin-19